MNDRELDNLLKSAVTPDRPADFWERLPARVTAKLHWEGTRTQTLPRATRPRRLAWVTAAIIACLVVSSAWFFQKRELHTASSQLAEAEKYLHEIEQLFPNQVQAIVFDENGPRLVLAEKPEVPDSPALYLKICGPRGCQRFVTFSGQQIRVNGENCDVLQDAAGNVLLIGKQMVWSSNSARRGPGGYHIEARALEVAS